MIRLTIDGKAIETAEGKTILEAARDNGVYIPTLCYHENLLSIGSCRICIVEVEGYTNPMVSCATPVQEGMAVTTRSDKLFRMRQDYLKLLLAYHPLECPICDAGGECDLQNLVFEHRIEKADLSVAREHKVAPYSTPLIKYFDNRCVLCLRCIHACREVSGRGVLDLAETGIEARMAPTKPRECISCGECQFVCPVGSLTENLSPRKSRVWQVERHTTTCPHCGFGCTFDLDVQEQLFVTDVIQKTDHVPNRGSLCVMGRFGYDFVNHEARLARIPEHWAGPVLAPAPSAEKAKEAFDRLSRINADGKGIGFIVSPRATNEEIFMLKEIAGRLKNVSLATPAAYHTGKVWKAFKAMNITYRYEYDGLLDADLIVIAGANLLSNNHLFGNRVRDAVKLKGAKVLVIDPAPTALTRIADAHLKVKPGKDGSLFNLFSRRLIEQGKFARESEACEGFEAFSSALKAVDAESALKETGVATADFERAIALLARATSVALIFGSGITAVEENLSAALNFAVLKGSDRKGLIMPVARESNAVGTVSILETDLEPHALLNDAGVEALFIYQDDPFHYIDEKTVQEAAKARNFVLVADALPTRIMDVANLVVPIGVFTQKDGTFVAGDGYGRTLKSMMAGATDGFEFLRQLLVLLGGTAYEHVSQVTGRLRQSGLLVAAGGTSGAAGADRPGAKFRVEQVSGSSPEGGHYTLMLRDLFINHHLIDKEAYSRGVSMVYEMPDYPIAEGRLFISPEDASALGIAEGENLRLESDAGSVSKTVSIKEGLRPGVLEWVVFRDRQEALTLSQVPVKWIDVRIRKG